MPHLSACVMEIPIGNAWNSAVVQVYVYGETLQTAMSLSAVVAVLVCALAARGAPVAQRGDWWVSPCGHYTDGEAGAGEGGATPLAAVHTQLKTQRSLPALHRLEAAYAPWLDRVVTEHTLRWGYWLPDSASVHQIEHTFASVKYALPLLLEQLQKFAVMFDLMISQAQAQSCEDRPPEALLHELKNRHVQLLCEVHNGLEEIDVRAKEAVGSDVMPESDRALASCTERGVRDYGALLRYRKVLDAWVHYTRGYS